MRLRGPSANPHTLVEGLLAQLFDAEWRGRIHRAAALIGQIRGRVPIQRQECRLAQGAIETAVIETLRRIDAAVRPKDVQRFVEIQLGQPVSYDTVCSVLTVAVRHQVSPIRRVARGLYEFDRAGGDTKQ